MRKKLGVIVALCLSVAGMAGCGLTDTLGITTSLKPQTEQEVLAEVANEADKENYHYVSSHKLSSYGDVHSGCSYHFSSDDRDLKFNAEATVKHYSDGWSYYEQDLEINYWSNILDLYEDDFTNVVSKYYDNLKPLSGDIVVTGMYEFRLPIKTPEDVDNIVKIYEELNTLYSAEQVYHAKPLDTYPQHCFWEMSPYIYDAGTAKYIHKHYYIDGSSEDIRDEIYSAVCEVAVDEGINLPEFGLENYVSETGFNKSSFSEIWVDYHKMTFKESAGVPYMTTDLIQYDDTTGAYYVRLCEMEYDATGTQGTSADYSTLSHYLRAIYNNTGMDYYVHFVSEGNKEKIYGGGDAVTTFEYNLDGSDYLLTFTVDCYNSTTTVTAERDGVSVPVRYEDATGLGCVFVNVDDFCSLLGLTYEIENVSEFHFYTDAFTP